MRQPRVYAQVALAILLIVMAPACAKKTKPDTDTPVPGSTVASGGDAQVRDSDSNSAMGLVTIHFSFDSNSIEGPEKQVLDKDAAILKQYPGLHVQIEGHCDQRGGSEYNLALGERRANNVKRLLTTMGVASSRITTISMGKEKPLAQGDGEDAYATNRRANFVVTSAE